MSELYNGWANWGTWNIAQNIIWGDAEDDMAELLAGVPGPDGAEAVQDRIEELAEYEPADGPLRSTLMREGTDNIDWDALALYWREEN